MTRTLPRMTDEEVQRRIAEEAGFGAVAVGAVSGAIA